MKDLILALLPELEAEAGKLLEQLLPKIEQRLRDAVQTAIDRIVADLTKKAG